MQRKLPRPGFHLHFTIHRSAVHRFDMGSSKKSCSNSILESCGLPGAKITFAMEQQDKGPSLCKLSRYLVVIKIMDISHEICHIYYRNADFESIFSQKDSLYCCYMFAKFSSTCKIIFIFSCILSSVLWDNFLWMTLYMENLLKKHPISHITCVQ